MNCRACIIAAIASGIGFDAHAAAERLLLKEVVVAPTAAEFIAIFNPNATAVALSDYYLSDNSTYYLLVGSPTVDAADFIVRFPAGASIASARPSTYRSPRHELWRQLWREPEL